MSQPAPDDRAVLVQTIRAQLAVLSELDVAPLVAGLSLTDLRRVVRALALLCAALQAPDAELRERPTSPANSAILDRDTPPRSGR